MLFVVRFFNDRKVSAEVGVINAVEAEAPESSCHLSFNACADRIAECFAEGCADCGSCLDEYGLFGISKSCEYGFCSVFFVKGACRADSDALTAVNAGRVTEGHIVCAADRGLETSVVRADNADRLEMFTGGYAAAAEDTFVVVADHMGCGFVEFEFVHGTFICVRVVYAVFLAEGLQFAVAAPDAGKAFLVMIRKQEL